MDYRLPDNLRTADDDKVQIFFVMATYNGKKFVSANEANCADEAVRLLVSSMGNKKIEDIHIFAGLRFNWATRDLGVAEFDHLVTTETASKIKLFRRNPVNVSSFLDYVKEEFKEKLSKEELKVLKSVKKKVMKSF